MTVPTPASLKKISDEKRAKESTPPAEEVKSSTSAPERKSRAASGRTDRGPRKPNSQKTSSSTPSKAGEEKKAFVLQPNLTDRPFKNHEGLQKLRDSMPKSKTSSSGRKTTSGSTSTRGKRSSSSATSAAKGSSGSTAEKAAGGSSDKSQKPKQRARNYSPSRDAQKALADGLQGLQKGVEQAIAHKNAKKENNS